MKERLKIALNRLRALHPASTRRPVHVARFGELYRLRVDDKIVWAPGIRRWRLYRAGVEARLEHVARRYGLEDLSASGGDRWAVDVGAYMGEWTLFMLRRGFSVLAIEPDPLAAICLRRNLECHAPKGSRWEQDDRVCVQDGRNETTFHSEPTNADGSLFPSVKHISAARVLPAATLDAIVEDRIGTAGRVYALKMDAEGAEPEVLAGATKLLRGNLEIGIDAGYERQGARTVEECTRILVESGFSLRAAPSDIMVRADK